MKLITSLAIIALLTTAAPACAQVQAFPVMSLTGAQFLYRCTNLPPYQSRAVAAACVSYVAGIADGLQATGNACIDLRSTRLRPFPVALTWIRNHPAYGDQIASVTIRNALEYWFPCRAAAASQTQRPSAQAQMASVVQFVHVLAAAKELLVLLGMG